MKTLLIPSAKQQTPAQLNVWELLPSQAYISYLKGINTGDIPDRVNAEDLNRLVSGVPSVWARAQIFDHAFKFITTSGNMDEGKALFRYFEEVVSEWKGLVALLALHPDRIRVSNPIYMQREDDAPGALEDNSIPALLGRMLFEDAVAWTDPQDNVEKRPFLHLIYCNDILVGGTTPHTLVFSGVEYDLSHAGIRWFENGRLVDPVDKKILNNLELQQLYLLVNNIEKHLISDSDIKKVDLQNNISNWKKEIKKQFKDVSDFGSLNKNLTFDSLYQRYFEINQDVFFNKEDGKFISSNLSGSCEKIQVQEILLGSDYIHRLSYVSDDDKILDQDKLPVILLVVIDPMDKDKKQYFPLPLAKGALKIFGASIGDLVNSSVAGKAKLIGRLKDKNKELEVELILQVDGKSLSLTRKYKIQNFGATQGMIGTWPDFIHPDWENYYYYSEYPTNHPHVKAVPFFRGRAQNSTFLLNEDGELLLGDKPCKISNLLEISMMVKYPVSIASANDPTYEIIKANNPVAGVELRESIDGRDHVCGFLVLKGSGDLGDVNKGIKSLNPAIFEDCQVGIDFGSNNSCLWYSKPNHPPIPVSFKNRRVFLLGCDVHDPEKIKPAQPHELRFFQNEEITNGQVKSWLQEHDHRYVSGTNSQDEVCGGMTVFENNLLIQNMDKQKIRTNTGDLRYSMKWLTDEGGNGNCRYAFMKTLWIQVCANLFANGLKPRELKWSYPGAFTDNEISTLQRIYTQLQSCTPIKEVSLEVMDGVTEAEAVCNYLLSKNACSDQRKLILGIDVGGSTSDILIIGKGVSSQELLHQASVRLAAGTLSEVALRSSSVRTTLLQYHEAKDLKIFKIKDMIERPETASYYLNSIFDRVEPGKFCDFYHYLATNNSRHLLAVPAFICGSLMFYSGQLVACIVQERGPQGWQIEEIDLHTSGKGGRLFDWLSAHPGSKQANQYLKDCFSRGVGNLTSTPKLNININAGDPDKKSEVAQGLLARNAVIFDKDQHHDIFGEKGFSLTEARSIAFDDEANSKYFENLDKLIFPEKLEVIHDFLELFIDFCSLDNAHLVSSLAGLKGGLNQMKSDRLKTYISNDPEWRKAEMQFKDSSNKQFNFKHSMLMLEAMCYLDTFLIPEICKK